MSSGFWPDLQYSRPSVTFLSTRERTNSRASWKALYSLSWLATCPYQASRRIHAIYPYKQYWGPSVYLAACTRICGIHTTLRNPADPESGRTHEPPQRSETACRHFSHCQYRASRPSLPTAPCTPFAGKPVCLSASRQTQSTPSTPPHPSVQASAQTP